MIPVGRVRGHRGRHGELTVDVARGPADRWLSVSHVWIGSPDGVEGKLHRVETIRGYRDRLVLKLAGLEDPTQVAALRGRSVKVRVCDAPALPPGEEYVGRLVGLDVLDDKGRSLGRVRDVVPTRGTDLLVVRPAGDGEDDDGSELEFMVPMAKSIVLEVSPDLGRIVIRPPEGLVELNRPRTGGES